MIRAFQIVPFDHAGSRDIPDFGDFYIKKEAFPQGLVCIKTHTGTADIAGCPLLGVKITFTGKCIGDRQGDFNSLMSPLHIYQRFPLR